MTYTYTPRHYVKWSELIPKAETWQKVDCTTGGARRSAKVALRRTARTLGFPIEIEAAEGFSFRFKLKEMIQP